MSSSYNGLTRSRSTRQTRAEAERNDEPQRNASPSRLPIKGVPTSTASSSSSRVASGATGTRSRPLSAVFGRTKQATGAGQESSTTSTTTTRPPRTTRATTLTRPPSQTSTTSSSRPTTSSGLPTAGTTSRQRAASSHARTKSSVTTLTGATTLRPPSQGSTTRSAPQPTPAPTDRSRPPITRSNAPSHRRQLSGPTPSTTTAARTRPQPAPQPAVDRHRPAFTTLQQHYSPAKSLAPKPLTATFLAPPSPSKLPSNLAISAETARLQTELLQLHLLHRSAHDVTAQWRASAKEKLCVRFDDILAKEDEVTRLERRVEEARNAQALVDWAGRDGKGLEEKIQTLDAVLGTLWALGEPGGRYVKVVRRFEKWIGKVEETVTRRERVGGLEELVGAGEEVLVGEMDAGWKEEVRGLGRRLEEVMRGLRGLEVQEGEGEEESSLGRIVRGCGVLVRGMLEELDVMEVIEREVARDEMRWVREVNRGVGEETRRAGAIWRVF
ncbi:hypothetical protein QBC34DRAFT_454065 [Podospora aff. communis PSN243]|uniref:Uncharacterized protein n=1 Tax=Podospora aff. communis PSN243 TaxID=3040156 RepID=A0AAV9H7K4_9PEZI|nr:hypothetical protein QBC34DRAFT_454065 [Podospora aff. communis PSN243]